MDIHYIRARHETTEFWEKYDAPHGITLTQAGITLTLYFLCY
jgi:hypothetical protein